MYGGSTAIAYNKYTFITQQRERPCGGSRPGVCAIQMYQMPNML